MIPMQNKAIIQTCGPGNMKIIMLDYSYTLQPLPSNRHKIVSQKAVC